MDLALRNGIIIDGSGAPRRSGDVGIRDGRIVAIGAFDGSAKREIDVGGAAIAPGFIDCHTHYDAQVMWDHMLSPSVYHGVTTVIGGNCGFTLAPLSGQQQDTDYLLGMLSNVEGMPLKSLEAAVKPNWTSFGGYLEALDGKLAINAAFLVGHSTLRRHVMGERAVGHEATPEEIEAMCTLLRTSLAEGGMGFSSSVATTHGDHRGDPVPSRWATEGELLALAGVVKDYPGTWVEFLPGIMQFGDKQYALATEVALAAQRPLNWNLFYVDSRYKDVMETQLGMGPYAKARGAKVYGLCAAAPVKSYLNFRSTFAFGMVKGWEDFIHLPHDEKLAAMRDPTVRAKLRRHSALSANSAIRDPGKFIIEDGHKPENLRWKGRLVAELAREHGIDPFDALFDLAIEEDLSLAFSNSEVASDEESWTMRGKVWDDEHCLVGGSDAGAHLDMINTFALSTQLLGDGVRERGMMTLEQGVHRLTGHLADAFGLKGRGRLEVGAAADICVFDPETVACAPIVVRDDLPGGQSRLYAESIGIGQVIVNGVVVAVGNEPSGDLGGRILRSGLDSYTVKLS